MFTDGSWMGHGIGMWIFWIIFIVILLVLLRVFAVNGSGSDHQQSPLEILKARYARGEIDEEEFSRRKKELES